MAIKTLLIDGDISLYRCAFAAQHRKALVTSVVDGEIMEVGPWGEMKKAYKEDLAKGLVAMEEDWDVDPEDWAINSLSERMEDCRQKFGGEVEMITFIGPLGKLIRHEIFPDYKGGRKPKPIHYTACRMFLEQAWDATCEEGFEADDVLGWSQFADVIEHNFVEADCTTCIVTVDKDLDGIPGWHYNPVKDEFKWVSYREANLCFFSQWLSGDPTDNIDGLKGVKDITARKMMGDATSLPDLTQVVYNAYWEDAVKNAEGPSSVAGLRMEVKERMLLVGELIWIRRTKDESFTDFISELLIDIKYTGKPKCPAKKKSTKSLTSAPKQTCAKASTQE